jgi:glycogen synthase
MKELLFILDYYTPHRGGIENVFENLISHLLQKNYHIYLITSHFDATLPSREDHHHLTIHRVGSGRKSFFFAALWKGILLLKKHPQIQVIHSSTYTSAFPASMLGAFFRKKRILTVHEIF